MIKNILLILKFFLLTTACLQAMDEMDKTEKTPVRRKNAQKHPWTDAQGNVHPPRDQLRVDCASSREVGPSIETKELMDLLMNLSVKGLSLNCELDKEEDFHRARRVAFMCLSRQIKEKVKEHFPKVAFYEFIFDEEEKTASLEGIIIRDKEESQVITVDVSYEFVRNNNLAVDIARNFDGGFGALRPLKADYRCDIKVTSVRIISP